MFIWRRIELPNMIMIAANNCDLVAVYFVVEILEHKKLTSALAIMFTDTGTELVVDSTASISTN